MASMNCSMMVRRSPARQPRSRRCRLPVRRAHRSGPGFQPYTSATGTSVDPSAVTIAVSFSSDHQLPGLGSRSSRRNPSSSQPSGRCDIDHPGLAPGDVTLGAHDWTARDVGHPIQHSRRQTGGHTHGGTLATGSRGDPAPGALGDDEGDVSQPLAELGDLGCREARRRSRAASSPARPGRRARRSGRRSSKRHSAARHRAGCSW